MTNKTWLKHQYTVSELTQHGSPQIAVTYYRELLSLLQINVKFTFKTQKHD